MSFIGLVNEHNEMMQIDNCIYPAAAAGSIILDDGIHLQQPVAKINVFVTKSSNGEDKDGGVMITFCEGMAGQKSGRKEENLS